MSDTTVTRPAGCDPTQAAVEGRLHELGVFVRETRTRRARDAWAIGQALLEARALCPRGRWGRWCEEYCPGLRPATRKRYVKVAQTYARKEADTQTLMELYRGLGIRNGAAKESPAGTVGSATRTKKRTDAPHEGGNHADPASDDGCRPDDTTAAAVRRAVPEGTPPVVLVVPARPPGEQPEPAPEEQLKRELGLLPGALGKVRAFVAELRAHPEALRRKCWECIDDRGGLLEVAHGLRNDMTWLVEDMPGETARAA